MAASPPAAGAAAIERAVLARIRPDAELVARLDRAGRELAELATRVARERGYPLVRAFVAGSAARGTFVRDRIDLDFFLLFPPTLPRGELERIGLELGAAILTDVETRYAEHPYRRGRFAGFPVDAVPGYAIDDPSHPLTAVDRTPFHQAYLAERQDAAMVDQVRLTKQFLRALGVYGSEARRGGFSGYLVELLVLRFGSLDGLLDAARSWRVPVRFLSRPGAAPRVPEDVALVLDDPVDAQRNVATALTRRNLALFVLAADRYCREPTAEAFEIRPPAFPTLAASRRRVAERGTHVAALTLPRPSLVDDILYPQLRKAERAVGDEASRLGFPVLGTASAAGPTELVVVVEVEYPERPAVRRQDGPPAGIDRVGQFLAKWAGAGAAVLQGPFVTADGRLAVDVRREERRLEPLLDAALDHLPIGRDLRALRSDATRFRRLDAMPESPPLVEALDDLLGKRLPWLGPPAAPGGA